MLALRFVCRRHVPRVCAHASLSTSAASSTPPPPQAPGEIETEENVDVTKRLGRQMESLGDTVVVTKDGVSDVQSPNSPFAKRLDKLPQDRTSGSRDLYSEKAGYLTAKQLNALLDLSRDHATVSAGLLCVHLHLTRRFLAGLACAEAGDAFRHLGRAGRGAAAVGLASSRHERGLWPVCGSLNLPSAA
jgi:hypothetical protein